MPCILHFVADMGADVLVEAAQDVVAAIDHGDVGAEAGEDAGEFQRDIAAALDHHALRQRRQVKRLIRGDHVLDAGNGSPWFGAPPVAISTYFARDGLAGRQPHGVRILDHRARLDDRGAGLPTLVV